MAFYLRYIVVVLVMLGFTAGCRRPPDTSAEKSSDSGAQKLPFNGKPQSSGISPGQTLVPSSTKLPEGTPIPVRLQTTLSSASSHAGDTFNAVLDEPLAVDGQTLVARGTTANGRVLEAKASTGPADPGYLRVILVSLNLGKRRVVIYTSSIFAKGIVHEGAENSGAGPDGDRDIVFGNDRRLNFRLAQTADLE